MKLPPPLTLTNLVGDLIDRRVTSKATPAMKPESGKLVAATYRDETGALMAVAVCDIAIGASFAAALTMVPVERVDESVRDGALDDVLRGNLHEVFNVLSAAFPMSGAPRVILHEMRCRQEAPAEIAAVLAGPSSRVDLELAVAGYRSGRFALLAA